MLTGASKSPHRKRTLLPMKREMAEYIEYVMLFCDSFELPHLSKKVSFFITMSSLEGALATEIRDLLIFLF